MAGNERKEVLVGDDQIETVRLAIDAFLEGRVLYVDNPEDFIRFALTGQYSVMITDLQYTLGGNEGFNVLKKIKDVKGRKILCTSIAFNEGVQEKGKKLGADEVTDMAGMFRILPEIEAELSEMEASSNGKRVLIYWPADDIAGPSALASAVGTFVGSNEFDVRTELPLEALQSNEYGLIVAIGDSARAQIDSLDIPDLPEIYMVNTNRTSGEQSPVSEIVGRMNAFLA